MENATQALLIAAGVLIALVVISLGINFFSSTSAIAESYEKKMTAVEIQKFNNQFEKYSKQPQYVFEEKDSDGKFLRYIYKTELKPEESASGEYIFHDYNSISDVVSAINLAYSINSNNQFEQDASIQVSISKGNDSDNIWEYPDCIGINPSIQSYFFGEDTKKLLDKYKVYEIPDPDSKYISTNFPDPDNDLIDLNTLLEKFNTSKLDNNNERVYEYGFKGETIINEKTRLIDIIKFELVKNEAY